MRQRGLWVIALWLWLPSPTALAFPWEVSYSAQLLDEGQPYTGGPGNPHSLRLRFFDAATGGNTIPVTFLNSPYPSGTPLTVANTYLNDCTGTSSCLAVAYNSAGVFQVPIYLTPADFDRAFPDSEARWIEVQLGAVAEGLFTVMRTFPRQRFGAVPYC